MKAPTTLQKPPSSLHVWAALWVIYIVWGSTYLAIRVTVETLPPMLSAGARFLVAGTLMYLWLVFRRGLKAVAVRPRELAGSAFVGTALLLGGNGLVAVAEQDVPSGLAALLIASVPLWVVVLRWATGDRAPRGTVLGVAVGFVGVGLLVLPGTRPEGVELFGLVLLILASIAWATGSFFSRYVTQPSDALLATAMQMLTGGAALVIAGASTGEFAGIDAGAFSGASIAAWTYLVVIGSLLAFTAYVWLLKHAPISKVATYAYVNPVVAIVLGWLILDEAVSPWILLGAAIIVGSVAAIVRKEAGASERSAAEAAPAEPALAAAEG